MITSTGSPRDFPGGTVAKNTPGSAGWYLRFLPWSGKVQPAVGQPSPVPRLLSLLALQLHTGEATPLSRWRKLARSSKDPAPSKE